MFKSIMVELRKNCRIKQLLFYLCSIFILCFLITFIENNMMSEKLGYDFNLMSFLEYNSTFLICKLIFPIFMLYLSSLVFAADYYEGTLKYFLFSGITRTKLYLGKMLYLLLLSIISVVIIFAGLGFSYLIFGGIDNSIQYLWKAFFSYILIGIGCYPIILIAAFMALVFGQHTKTLFVSIGILILSLCIDSVIGAEFYSPTSFISNANLYFTELSAYKTYVVSYVAYTLGLIITTLTLFNLKDIWN
ncbi:MAG: ABC transporter permease [Mageeibacillus sp.]|nr:ABC transporter permease [Mageeibacillus sp.]MCI2043900.1 ABC transporter permease [Mageeibacillus sp.]